MKLTALSQSPVQHALIYGPPKTGKTQLVSELAREGFNILHFDLENGRGPYYKLPQECQERVEMVVLPDTRDYPIAIETMLKVIKGKKNVICDIHGKVECPICKAAALKDPTITFTTVELNNLDSNTIVVVDSLTQLTNSGIAHITRGKPDDYKLDYSDWGNLGKLMDIFLSSLQQAPFNIICISHETEAELEDGKVKIVPTAGTRNFSRNSAKYFDTVIYAQVSNAKHTFTSMTTQTMNIVVGSRTDVDLKATGSLAPIFKGTIGAPAQSNGQKAAASLSTLLKK